MRDYRLKTKQVDTSHTGGSVKPRAQRIRMEIEAKANNHCLFFGENGGPLILCSRQIDKGRPGQCYIKMSFV